MRMLLNGLSATNASGRYVLMGHLQQLQQQMDPSSAVILVLHPSWQNVPELPNVKWHAVSPQSWWQRTLWERRHIPALIKMHRLEHYFSVNGIVPNYLKIPTYTLGQNPWALLPNMPQGWRERCKAWLQRRQYAKTQRIATGMLYVSRYLQSLYDRNAGHAAKRSAVVHTAPAANVLEAANAHLATAEANNPVQRAHIVMVSAMARHKRVEDAVQALADLHALEQRETLRIVGGWPDADYRHKVEQLVASLQLNEYVVFAGHVSDEQLCAEYANAKLLLVMSECESFGIPALEAQCFATPVVSVRACAMPEVLGDGALYCDLYASKPAAEQMQKLLTDATLWAEVSAKALLNSQSFRWPAGSKPLVEMLSASA